MKNCPNCGKELKDTAKFCGKCGTKIDEIISQPTPPPNDNKGLEMVGDSGFIRWTMLQGQLAVKIDESEISEYGKVKGLVIQDGTKALFFVNGKLTAELSAGNYKFSDYKKAENTHVSSTENRAKGFWGFLRNTCEAAARAFTRVNAAATNTVLGDKTAISVVLVRSTEFPLIFNIKDANTANIRSDVGVHLLCKVTNINEFYKNFLLDKKFISYDEVRERLDVVIKNQVNNVISVYEPQKVANNSLLNNELLAQLQIEIANIYPFIAINKLLQISAENADMQRLRQMSEELYVSQQELTQLQKRNDFLNQLQSVKNEQELAELSSSNKQDIDKSSLNADFSAKKLEIYKRMELTKDEQEKFDLMLSAEKQLREAKTQEEIDIALHDYEKSGMLRERELDDIRHKGVMQDLRNMQEYDMASLQGNLAAQRTQDTYEDERRQKEVEFQDARRKSDLDFEKQEMQQQMDMLRQAQALRMERENAEHKRILDAENAARAHEEAMQKQKLEAELENQRIYAGMSFEQIMAANPNISPEAAKALAQKFGADNKEELLKAREADMARMNSQQMEMMRMMQQMAMAGMGANQQHSQEMMQAKQDELDRTRADANRNQDRFLAGMQTTISSVAAGMQPKQEVRQQTPLQQAQPIQAKVLPKCPSCGVELELDSTFCAECGTAL